MELFLSVVKPPRRTVKVLITVLSAVLFGRGLPLQAQTADTRHTLTRSAWDAAVRKARGPFEPFGARKLLGASFQTKLPGVPLGEYVVLQYQTKVGGGKTVVKTVTPMKDQDGSWRVSGYYIRPE